MSMVMVVVLPLCTKDKPHIERPQPQIVKDGKEIFRFDTFGDEDFWSGLLHIDKAIAGKENGGFGPGVSPAAALAVGLKVDATAIPSDVVAGIKSGAVDLNDPATTIELLRPNAAGIRFAAILPSGLNAFPSINNIAGYLP